jgi:hypothetical protein
MQAVFDRYAHVYTHTQGLLAPKTLDLSHSSPPVDPYQPHLSGGGVRGTTTVTPTSSPPPPQLMQQAHGNSTEHLHRSNSTANSSSSSLSSSLSSSSSDLIGSRDPPEGLGSGQASSGAHSSMSSTAGVSRSYRTSAADSPQLSQHPHLKGVDVAHVLWALGVLK